MRILAASPVRQKPEILSEYGISLLNLKTHGIQVSFLFIDDNISLDSSLVLQNIARALKGTVLKAGSLLAPEYMKEDNKPYSRHKWNRISTFRVGELRNRILEYARDRDFDGLFFVDSDLLLHPDTLKHLIELDKDIISEIYWTRWSHAGPLCPQVWLYDNYTQYEMKGEELLNAGQIRERAQKFYDMLRKPGVYKVGGLGGCTLLSKKVLHSGVSFTPIYNLSFNGEDRHFCVRAAVKGFELYVDTTYPAYHIYRDSDLPGCKEFKKMCAYAQT